MNTKEIIYEMKTQAKRNSILLDGKSRTGECIKYRLAVRYYPACQRFTWFNDTGPITQFIAKKILERYSDREVL
jgi:hypothetical protein